ncbi:MAG: hypothetical protein R3236_02335 [Phycisphaeraceae bacterium]|nr:hypothetical protein [Phycisphaeraceae bacterium]
MTDQICQPSLSQHIAFPVPGHDLSVGPSVRGEADGKEIEAADVDEASAMQTDNDNPTEAKHLFLGSGSQPERWSEWAM